MTERACKWMRNGFMSVDTKLGAGRAFLRSLYQQYADWGVDYGNMLDANIIFLSHYCAIALLVHWNDMHLVLDIWSNIANSCLCF